MKMTGRKFPARTRQTIPGNHSTETTVSEITSPFHDRFLKARELFKSGTADESLLVKVTELRKIVDADAAALRVEDEIHYLKAKAFICEVYDHFGCIQESKQVIREGEQIRAKLPQAIERSTSLEKR